MGANDRVNKSELMAEVSRASGIPLRDVNRVYDALVDRILVNIRDGVSVTLTNFGRFYAQRHRGHRVQFHADGSGDPGVIDDYRVLKFSATREVNRSLDSTH